MTHFTTIIMLGLGVTLSNLSVQATVLWHDEGSRVVHDNAGGGDFLGGKVKRDDKASDVLYFKFHVNPISDAASEPYFAGFQLYLGDEAHLGVGNAEEAWGYSAFNTLETSPDNKVKGEFNLFSAHPEPMRLGTFWPYELVHHYQEHTIVFKVRYIPGGDDEVTVWLDPHLGLGDSEQNQPANIITRFHADATFDQIRLRHAGGGNGWFFSDMAIATSFDDFIVVRYWQTWWFISLIIVVLLAAVGVVVHSLERRKYRLQLECVERANIVERERARIAQDLHDDLGSSLTHISLLSDLLRTERDNPEQTGIRAEKISESADQTVRALEEIVWAVRPGSDTLASLVDYIAHFANDLFAGKSTRCRLELPSDVPVRALLPDVRHNIFLIVKESLTNILKHADASEVHLQLKITGTDLEINITDNGKGFDLKSTIITCEHNGLENMRCRAEAVGGTFALISAPGQGSRMEIRVHFPD